MSRWGRLLGIGAGVVMIVGGLLVLEGSRWGYLLVAGAAVVVVVGPLTVGRRGTRSTRSE
jgi:hypothetical protein